MFPLTTRPSPHVHCKILPGPLFNHWLHRAVHVCPFPSSLTWCVATSGNNLWPLLHTFWEDCVDVWSLDSSLTGSLHLCFKLFPVAAPLSWHHEFFKVEHFAYVCAAISCLLTKQWPSRWRSATPQGRGKCMTLWWYPLSSVSLFWH